MRRIVAKLQVCSARDHLLNDIQITCHHSHRKRRMAIFPKQIWTSAFIGKHSYERNIARSRCNVECR